MVKEITLTRGDIALVDDDDYAWISTYKWHATGNRVGYANRLDPQGKKHIPMHRDIMSRHGHEIEGKFIDHIDRNPLNNQKNNLRVCTLAQNTRNTGAFKGNKCGYKGVAWDTAYQQWCAKICVDGKRFFLGRCSIPEVCAVWYNDAARTLHGEFAGLNEIPLQIEFLARQYVKPGKGHDEAALKNNKILEQLMSDIRASIQVKDSAA